MSHLTKLAPLIQIIAAERTKGRPELFEDAVQEGMIRAWMVEAKKPDAPREYVLAAARNGVADLVRGRRAFGAPSHQGRQDAMSGWQPFVVDDDYDEDETLDLTDAGAELATEQALMAAHRADVSSAVATLPDGDADLVLRRFWLDQTYPDVAKAVGTTVAALQRRFVNHIRPALRERLEHLEAAA
jgi:RNA polymerase sigma factor (sigma-70 family)